MLAEGYTVKYVMALDYYARALDIGPNFALKKVAIIHENENNSVIGVLNRSGRVIRDTQIYPNWLIRDTRDEAMKLRSEYMPKHFDLVVLLEKYNKERYWNIPQRNRLKEDDPIITGQIIKRKKQGVLVDIGGLEIQTLPGASVLVTNTSEVTTDDPTPVFYLNQRTSQIISCPKSSMLFGDHFVYDRRTKAYDAGWLHPLIPKHLVFGSEELLMAYFLEKLEKKSEKIYYFSKNFRNSSTSDYLHVIPFENIKRELEQWFEWGMKRSDFIGIGELMW